MPVSVAILQLILGCALLGVVVGVPSVLIIKKLCKMLSYRQATWVIGASYLISLAFVIAAYLVTSYFKTGDSLVGLAWLFVFGYSITKISEKKYAIKNTKFPAVGAQVAFWILVLAWGVVAALGLGWLIYYGFSKL
jgi:hypothetical protein